MISAGLKIACLIAYTYSVIVLLRDYASFEWTLYGLSYSSPTIAAVMQVGIFLFLAGWICPQEINSPSTLMLIICFLLIIIPSVVCLFFMDPRYVDNPTLASGFMVGGFALSCAISQRKILPTYVITRAPHKLLIPSLMVFAIILLAFLYWRFGSVMSFVALDSIYEQRERGAAENLVEGYAQTYSQYVLSTGLLALGLYYRQFIPVALGLFGSVTNYMITAEKAGLTYPLFVIAMFLIIRANSSFLKSTPFLAALFAGILLLSVAFYRQSPIAEFSAWYLGMRTILTSGNFIVHYLNFFESVGYTFFSHVRGLDFFVPVPVEFANDVRFPGIGLIIGEDYFNFPKLNANANFVASDGIASLGLIGIPLAFVAFGLFLRMFDWAARGVGPVSILLLLPIALTFTNGSMLTTATSFGGFLWVVILKYGFVPSQRSAQPLAQPRLAVVP